MDWDVFICHAWEDKESFVRPLAKALEAKGLRVWFDEFTLTVGDSLRRSIDRGLANSRYGIVVLSPNFFAKEWPQKELDGLASREVSGEKVILPVWHNITADQVSKYSPTLADRIAVSSSRGLEHVVAELLRVMRPAPRAVMKKSKPKSPMAQTGPELQSLPSGLPPALAKLLIVPAGPPSITAANAAQVELLGTWKGPTGILCVAFAPDGETLVSGSEDGVMRLWQVGDWVPLHTLAQPGTVLSVAFVPDGTTLASWSNDGWVRLWQVSDGKLLRMLEGHVDQVWGIAFSSDGQTLASGSGDGTVRLWRVVDWAPLRTLKWYARQRVTDEPLAHALNYMRQAMRKYTGWINNFAFSPDGQIIALGLSHYIALGLWQVSDGTPLRWLMGHKDWVHGVAFSSNGQILASGSRDQTVRLWQVADGALLRMLKGHTAAVNSVVFSPDDTTLASGSDDKTVRLWRVLDGMLLQTLKGHTGGVNSVAFSPDGATLASGSQDGTVRLWGVK